MHLLLSVFAAERMHESTVIYLQVLKAAKVKIYTPLKEWMQQVVSVRLYKRRKGRNENGVQAAAGPGSSLGWTGWGGDHVGGG